MVRLRRHCECLAELTPEEAASLGPMVPAVCRAVSRVVEPERVYVCYWGEGVRHVHFQVIPRPSGMPAGNLPVSALLRAMLLLDRLGVRRFAPDDREVAVVAGRLREEVRRLGSAT